MTIHKLKKGKWSTFEGLSDLSYAIDRDYQVVQPKLSVFKKKGKIISLEK
jgi:hypothetical protein